MSQDTLSEVLRSIRLHGALFYHVEGDNRWVSEAPHASRIGAAVMPGADHVMAYHAVTSGSCWATVVGRPPVKLAEGDVVVFPHGDGHVMSSHPGMRGTIDLDAYSLPRPQQLPFYTTRQGQSVSVNHLSGVIRNPSATLVCGFFGCDARPFNPLLASLPELLHVRATPGDNEDWIVQFIRFALSESRSRQPGGEAFLERLSETMFVELVRRYIATLPEASENWLAGLRDRHVGRALSLLHGEPAANWTMERLAQQAGLSRSALHERFLRFTGHTPMNYLARWRMQLAASLLRQSSASLASIAVDVGYESEAAFSRAFRRETGVPPGAWRRDQARGPTPVDHTVEPSA